METSKTPPEGYFELTPDTPEELLLNHETGLPFTAYSHMLDFSIATIEKAKEVIDKLVEEYNNIKKPAKNGGFWKINAEAIGDIIILDNGKYRQEFRLQIVKSNKE